MWKTFLITAAILPLLFSGSNVLAADTTNTALGEIGSTGPVANVTNAPRHASVGRHNRVTGPFATVQELNINECEQLGCTAINDRTCAAVEVPGAGTIQKRCVCSGGGSLCIDKNAW